MDNGGRQILQEHYQVIVVGAGPAGSAAARFCALSGLKTLIIEEHATPGYPVQCAGLLSINAFQECEVSNESIINTVYGARIETESGHELIFRSKREKAHVVDRAILDIEMLRLAAEAGADVRTKTIAWEINSHEIKTIGINGTASIEYDILIAADGPRSRIRRLLNLNPPKTFIGGVQVEIPWKGEDDIVHIYPDSSPSFFGWVIPLSGNRARVGLCGVSGVPQLFKIFRLKFKDLSLHSVSGVIPLGVMNPTWKGRVLFVGDSAGFAKPTSGGGVYTGVRSARHAAFVAKECIEKSDYSERAISRYESLWKKDIGHELAIGWQLFKMRGIVTQSELESIIISLNKEKNKQRIIENGDMDRPARLIASLLKDPEILAQSICISLKYVANNLKIL